MPGPPPPHTGPYPATLIPQGYRLSSPLPPTPISLSPHPHTCQGSQHELQTNNQWLSMTDQLNLGVRVLELDVHFVAVGTIKGEGHSGVWS